MIDGDTISLDSGVEGRGGAETFDPATYVASAVFNAVALPADMPDFLKAAIESRAEQARAAAAEAGFVNATPRDLVDGMTREERERQTSEGYMAALVSADERHQRDRAEWARTSSTVGGVTLTGEEWKTLAERLRSDDDLRRRLIEAFEAKGATHDEAVKRVDRVAEVADATATPPAQRTDKQKAIIREVDDDPKLRGDMKTAADAMQANPAQQAKTGLGSQFSAAADPAQPQAEPVQAIVTPRPVTTVSGPGF